MKRLLQRCCAIFGMIAMLGALAAVPLASTIVHAATPAVADGLADGMPCHKPAQPKPCPDCPQKACPEMGACFVKCSQQIAPLVAGGHVGARVITVRLPPSPSEAAASLPVPPLLRPPSV